MSWHPERSLLPSVLTQATRPPRAIQQIRHISNSKAPFRQWPVHLIGRTGDGQEIDAEQTSVVPQVDGHGDKPAHEDQRMTGPALGARFVASPLVWKRDSSTSTTHGQVSFAIEGDR
ncbi:hypothetical protein ACFWC5_32460 [Streptomyces sp. NPDC060085]|uniref:hypothetical protein n=1 Tax=Streptomyces sp. NPDC060085 TaxID=3347054 RepID=UPI003653A858